jgi:hypothetical protein
MDLNRRNALRLGASAPVAPAGLLHQGPAGAASAAPHHPHRRRQQPCAPTP